MKHSLVVTWILGLLTIGFSGCTETEEEAFTPQLVVEGWIENGRFPEVLLGITLPISKEGQNMEEYVVRWGKVTLSDGEREVVLTGMYDKNHFPPFKYTTYDMRGEVGKTYTLTAEYRGLKAFARTTIPAPVPIDSTRIVQVGDTTRYVKTYFTDDPAQKNYYILFSKRESCDTQFLLSFLGVLDDSTLPAVVGADVYRGSEYQAAYKGDGSIYFKPGEVVSIRLATVNEASYRFWKSFSSSKNLSSNMILPYTINLESNIQGGLGYWCGYGSSNLTVRIP